MEGSIFEHFSELRTIIIGAAFIVAGWVRMEVKTNNLTKAHNKMSEALKKKTNVETCEDKHSMAREGQQLIISTIERGFSEVREDIRHISDRLDNHIQFNGAKK
jgi:hypothetical protein